MQKDPSKKTTLIEQDLGPIYKQGLVHNIYLSGKFIIKIPKKEFSDFNNKEHFILEKKCLELLKVHGIPVPNHTEVSDVFINGTKYYCLIESFIKGDQVNWDELDNVSLSDIYNIYNTSHKIGIDGAGPLNHMLKGSNGTWVEYIKLCLSENKNYLMYLPSWNLNRKIFLFLEKYISNISKGKTLNKNVLLLVDFNPGNIFFDVKGNIVSVIDIDHPMGGDSLFDYAPINWHHKETFQKLRALHLSLKSGEFFSILYYTLVYGLNTIVWRLHHGLSCEEEFDKLLKFYSEIILLSP